MSIVLFLLAAIGLIAFVLFISLLVDQYRSGVNKFSSKSFTSIDDFVQDVPVIPGEFPTLSGNMLAQKKYQNLYTQYNQYLVGQDELFFFLCISLLTDGHLLLEGVPGLAKTRAIQVFSRLTSLSFGRIQFTPDMMPADIIGAEIFDRATNSFVKRRGPIVGYNLILADEINRTPPKVQAAMLECMQERQITIAGETKILPDPFIVLATQNPLDQNGTFPLPEAQRDRFLAQVNLHYPTFAQECEILTVTQSLPKESAIDDVLFSPDIWKNEKNQCMQVTISDKIGQYIVAIVQSTRCDRDIRVGASPRAGRSMFRAAQALAYLCGEDTVSIDHVLAVSVQVLQHRVVLSSGMADRRLQIITRCIQSVIIPR